MKNVLPLCDKKLFQKAINKKSHVGCGALMQKWQYVEPKHDEIFGSFLHSITKDLTGATGKKNISARNKSTVTTTIECADIRALFKTYNN